MNQFSEARLLLLLTLFYFLALFFVILLNSYLIDFNSVVYGAVGHISMIFSFLQYVSYFPRAILNLLVNLVASKFLSDVSGGNIPCNTACHPITTLCFLLTWDRSLLSCASCSSIYFYSSNMLSLLELLLVCLVVSIVDIYSRMCSFCSRRFLISYSTRCFAKVRLVFYSFMLLSAMSDSDSTWQ